jgi:hypothetical protein
MSRFLRPLLPFDPLWLFLAALVGLIAWVGLDYGRWFVRCRERGGTPYVTDLSRVCLASGVALPND